jgi:3-deoxy-D-manno-octulosonate 8-phosphate phosphatase (KDO 8-P phosphatase)
LQHPPELLLKAQGIRVVFFDVDGVLTDGGLYFSRIAARHSSVFTRWTVTASSCCSVRGIIAVVITGRDSKPLRARLAGAGDCDHARFGTKDKRPAAERLAGRTGAGLGRRRPRSVTTGPICR